MSKLRRPIGLRGLAEGMGGQRRLERELESAAWKCRQDGGPDFRSDNLAKIAVTEDIEPCSLLYQADIGSGVGTGPAGVPGDAFPNPVCLVGTVAAPHDEELGVGGACLLEPHVRALVFLQQTQIVQSRGDEHQFLVVLPSVSPRVKPCKHERSDAMIEQERLRLRLRQHDGGAGEIAVRDANADNVFRKRGFRATCRARKLGPGDMI